jgi:hypothetical protein
MNDSEYLYLVHHDPATCATCRARRGESMICSICRAPLAPGESVMLLYISRETPRHRGIMHASCSRDEASDDTFIYY